MGITFMCFMLLLHFPFDDRSYDAVLGTVSKFCLIYNICSKNNYEGFGKMHYQERQSIHSILDYI